MEIHPPHEPVHSWRDTLIHIGLMTVGVFIALLLEGVVEHYHHRELVKQARENIRRELEENHKAAQENLQHLSDNAAKVKAGLDTLHFMRTHPNAHGQSITFTMEQQDLNDAAFRTARDTGAFGYMSYDEVQRYAGLYGFQEGVSNQARDILRQEAETIAPIIAAGEHFEGVPPVQYDDMLRRTAVNLLDVQILQQMMQSLDKQYVAALEQH
jgi:hypothetical protein